VWAMIPVAIATTAWFWPKRSTTDKRVATEVRP
jgi:hypothetical protein